MKELGSDILPVHTSISGATERSRPLPGGTLPWLMLLVPFCAYLAMLAGVRMRKRTVASQPAVVAKKAARNFLRRCRKGDGTAGDTVRAARDYLNERFALSRASVTPAEARDVLVSNGVSEETSGRFECLLQMLENTIYTGGGDESCGPAVEDAASLVTQIEKEIR